MCCCGDDTKFVVKIAGILGIIQSIVGIIMSSVQINKFSDINYDSQPVIVQFLKDIVFPIKILLGVYLVLQIYWLLSSTAVIVSNERGHACGVRQWIVSTSLVIIAEVTFPIGVVAATIPYFGNARMSRTVVGYDSTHFTSYGFPGFTSGYLALVATFAKAGLITLITNIVMCVYAGRRVQKLTSSTGHVISAVPVPTQVVAQPLQPYYPAQAQFSPQVSAQIVYPGQQPVFYNTPVIYQSQPNGLYQVQQPLFYPGAQPLPQQAQFEALHQPPPPPYTASVPAEAKLPEAEN